MNHCTRRTTSAARARPLIATLLTIILLSASAGSSRAMEFIPSVGFTKATDAGAGSGKFSGGVALRAGLLPFLKLEGGISYRQESFANGDLKVRMWPVTTSLWLTPVPVLYAGGGVGWYRASYDYASTVPFADVTSNQLGLHLGGGLSVPLAPSLGLDLNGRYIFMQQQNNVQFPTQFNPDFWSTTVGLAFKF
jgi:outer membrane protein with beta-barrel domain